MRMGENRIPWSEVAVTAQDLLTDVLTRLADPALPEAQRANLTRTRDLLVARIHAHGADPAATPPPRTGEPGER
jgi:hypothetical protein